MSKYDDTQPGECESCGWDTSELVRVEAYARQLGHGPFTSNEEKEWAWLCFVCRSTYAGNAYCYPRGYEGQIEILASIAWQTNYLASLIIEGNQARNRIDY